MLVLDQAEDAAVIIRWGLRGKGDIHMSLQARGDQPPCPIEGENAALIAILLLPRQNEVEVSRQRASIREKYYPGHGLAHL